MTPHFDTVLYGCQHIRLFTTGGMRPDEERMKPGYDREAEDFFTLQAPQGMLIHIGYNL